MVATSQISVMMTSALSVRSAKGSRYRLNAIDAIATRSVATVCAAATAQHV